MNNHIWSLNHMVETTLRDAPEQTFEALEGYLESLPSSEANRLKKALETDSYRKQFEKAITETSVALYMIFISVSDVFQSAFKLEDIKKEYILLARDDDQLIYNLRLFYLNGFDSDMFAGISDDVGGFTSEAEKEELRQRTNELRNQFQKEKASLSNMYQEEHPDKIVL